MNKTAKWYLVDWYSKGAVLRGGPYDHQRQARQDVDAGKVQVSASTRIVQLIATEVKEIQKGNG